MSATFAAPETPRADVRATIRDLLTTSADFQALPPETRREIAGGLVRICNTAVALADETQKAGRVTRVPAALARAQSAGAAFSGVAADRVAGTTRSILNAVSFPRFVTELLTGVFRALVDTNQQQMQSYVELIQNVAASTEGFADANVGVQGARAWLAERFPGSFVVEGDADDFGRPQSELSADEQAELAATTRLRLREGASRPSESALRTALGLGPTDAVPSGDPESLVPLARASLARNRQHMLATMVMLGMQRIVVESGRLHASMRFHIDTRSAAADDRGSTFDVRNDLEASANASFGPWGMEAKMRNTIGYVSTERTQTTEEMNTDLDLNSSVELVFKTDYLPLERLAGPGQVDRIRVNTLNPDAEAEAAAEERRARRDSQVTAERERRASTHERMAPTAPQTPAGPSRPAAGAPAASQQPAASEQPAGSQTPAPSEQPAGSQTPGPSEQPGPSDSAPAPAGAQREEAPTR